MEKLERLAKAVLSGDAQEAKDVSEDLLSSGCDPQEILDKGLLAGMQLVGEKFKNKSFYIPEVLLSSRAVHAGLNIIKPELTSQADAEKLATVVIGSVAGDLHDIGKNLVVLLLRANNFKVIDLGIDVTPESFLEAVSKYKPEILGLSALFINDDKWVDIGNFWMRIAWIFLTIGIALGGFWAYEVLGWGAWYWTWDPVETASLIPWLTATAYLHAQYRLKHEEFQTLVPILAIFSFVFVVFATFVTRSGLWASVHAWQDFSFDGAIMGLFIFGLIIASILGMLYKYVIDKKRT